MDSSVPRRTLGLTLLLGAVAFYWAIAMYPTPAWLLSDHGQGYQLAAAQEILAGRHPFLDFRDTYGPLTFYVSAAAQWLSGMRVEGELLLIAGAVTLGYVLLFRLMLACAVAPVLATVATLVAIAIQPAGYRYYLFVLPIVFLSAAFAYAAAPRGRSLALMALAATVAGLFRPDLGVYAFGTGLVMIFLLGSGRVRSDALGFTALVVAWALPWLAWLAAHGQLLHYLSLSSVEAMQEAAGRARPAPWPDLAAGIFSVQNAKAFLFRTPVLISIFAAIVMIARRSELRGAERARVAGAFAYALFCLPQASHIVDWIHVRDVLPVRVLLLAWIAAGVWPGTGRPWLELRPLLTCGTALVFAMSLAAAALRNAGTEGISPAEVATKLRVYASTRRELLATVRESGETFRAQLYEYVRDHSAPGETVFAVIEAPQTNYFAERGFAGRQMSIFPGYFARPEDQRALIEEIRRGPTAFVILDHTSQDDSPEIVLEKFAPEFAAFLAREFTPVRRVGYCVVLAPKWRETKR